MGKHPSIFLIDDDEDDRFLFQIALSDLPYKTVLNTAKSAAEGLLMLTSSAIRPDFVFLDLNMPQMDGKECLQELKKNASIAAIPVVIYSTSSAPHDIAITRRLGAVDFITKPARVEDLTQRLHQFLSDHTLTEKEQINKQTI